MTTNGVVNALYDRLLLRDVFSKIVPGITVVTATAVSVASPVETMGFFRELPVFAWIVLLCFSWIVGLAVQSIGESIKPKLILTFPPEIDWKEWVRMQAEFERRCSRQESQRNERLRVIKEASGNFYTALLLSIVLWILSVLTHWVFSNNIGCHWVETSKDKVVTVLTLVAFASWGLQKMHLNHVRLQYLYIQRILGSEKEEARVNAGGTQQPPSSEGGN